MSLICIARVLSRTVLLLATELTGCGLVFSEVNAVTLRAAFGPPVKETVRPKREIFKVRAAFDLTVSYSQANKVCAIDIRSGLADAEEVKAVLEKAMPSKDRGRMWNEIKEFDGLSGAQNTYYEKVIVIQDIFLPTDTAHKPGARVLFKDIECGWRAGQDAFDAPSRNRTAGHYR